MLRNWLIQGEAEASDRRAVSPLGLGKASFASRLWPA